MKREDNFTFKPDLSAAGAKSKEGEGVAWAWFSPVEEPKMRLRYAVVKEEDGVVSIQPDQGRFKKGLLAWRFATEDEQKHSVWRVVKTRPNRIDLQSAGG